MAVVVPWQQLFGVALRSGVDFTITDTTLINAPSVLPATGVYSGEGGRLFKPGTVTASSGTTTVGAHTVGIPASTWIAASEGYGVPVTNRPTFEPGQEINEYNKAIGESVATAGTGYNFMKSYMMPTTTFEFDLDRRTALPFLFAFFQAGTTATALNDTDGDAGDDIAVSYLFELPDAADGPSPSYFISTFKTLDFPDGELISDAVCTSMTLSGTENEPMKVSFELLGHMFTNQTFDQAGIISGSDVAVKFAEADPLHWNNVDVLIGNTIATGATAGDTDTHTITEASSFELTITAATTARRYNSRNPMRFVNNGYSVEGSITIPYGAAGVGGSFLNTLLTANTTSIYPVPIDLFFLNTSIGVVGDETITSAAVIARRNMSLLTGSSGSYTTVGTDGDLHIGVGAVLKSVSTSNDDETMITANFTGANIRSGNTVTQKAMRMSWLEDAAASGSSDFTYLGTRPTS